MRNKEDQGYRNPAYIYDEGSAGGGPDSRSGSSTSSKSSMKIISAKLKGQGRGRWLTLALIIFIAIVIIIAVTTAIYFTRNNDTSTTSGNVGEVKQTVTIETSTLFSLNTTHSASSPPSTSKLTTTLKTTTTKQPTTSKTTAPKTTTTSTTTTTEAPTTKRSTTTSTRTSSRSTSVSTATPSKTASTTKTSKKTDLPSTTTTTVVTQSSKNSSANITTPQKVTTTSTIAPNETKQSNLSVSMSEIAYHPDDVRSLTLSCEGRHQGDWTTLTMRRQFKDGYEPVAVAVLNEQNEVEVFKFYPNVTHVISVNDYDVTLILNFDPFLCAELTNFTCALANADETASTRANISIYMPEPVIILPHAIVENREITLRCVTEVWGSSAKLAWKFKPEFSTDFMDFSVPPVTKLTKKNCSTAIESILVFNASMFEDGADFRCEIQDKFNPQVDQRTSSEVTLKVVPDNYCEGKRQFTIHPHPHGPCTLVVYCLDQGPYVYEIECEPGHCYDYVKTACVPEDNVRR